MEKELHEINLRLKQLVALKMLENLDGGRSMIDDSDLEYDFDLALDRIREQEDIITEVCRRDLEEATEELGEKITL